MAHLQQLQFVKSVSASLASDYSNQKIIEIGSYDVNGSIRSFFNSKKYIGVDLTSGPGVDVVSSGDQVDHEDEAYDISISCECFEHNPKWVETFENMHRMTKKGGIVLMTCASTGRPEHGTTRTSPHESPGTQSVNWDYYQNLDEKDFFDRLKINEMFSEFFFINHQPTYDLYFLGLKGGDANSYQISINQLKYICENDLAQIEEVLKRKKELTKLTPKFLRRYINFGKNSPYQKNNSRLISNV